MRAFKVLIKKILKSDAVMFSACWLAAQYMRLAWYSGRWEIKGKENIDKLYDAGKPCIVCLWHGRLLMSTFGWQREKSLKMLISAHRDGALIANIVKHVGIDHITGVNIQRRHSGSTQRTPKLESRRVRWHYA